MKKQYETKIELFPKCLDEVKIIFRLSKNAILGFAYHCLYESVKVNDSVHWHIDPLGFIPGYKNQSFGFYITSDSPELIIQINNNLKNEYEYELNVLKSTDDMQRLNLENINERIMPYEESGENIIKISVLKNNDDITKMFSTVSMVFSSKGMKSFGEHLIALYEIFKEGENYDILNLNEIDSKIKDFGVALDIKSPLLSLECHQLGNTKDYDDSL